MVVTQDDKAAERATVAASKPPQRLFWVDNLRTAIILLVVNMHACVTYSHIGGWYVKDGPDPSLLTTIVFGTWQGHLQAFFMGLLFFVSGVFAFGSVFRKGPGAFMKERAIRLGGPALLYMLVIHPFIELGLNPDGTKRGSNVAWYREYLLSGDFIGSTGPLWFALALLIFCAGLAVAVRMGWVAREPRSWDTKGLSAGRLWTLGLGVALLTFLVRIPFPIGTSVLNFQFCFFPQYVVAFIFGLRVAREGTLAEIAASPIARRVGRLALSLGPLGLLAVFLLSGGKQGPMMGGMHPQALGYALWEQLAGLGLGLGMLALFAHRFQAWGNREKWLSDRAFAVYVLHAPILVALTMLYRPILTTPFVMVPLLTATGLIVSFAVAEIARRLPLLRSIL